MSENKILLEVQDLKKYFPVKGTKGPGVQAVSYTHLVPFTPDGRVDLARCRWDGR